MTTAAVAGGFPVAQAARQAPPAPPPPGEKSSEMPSEATDDPLAYAKEPPSEQTKQIDAWIADLGHPRFEARYKATRNLMACGISVLPRLRRTCLATKDLEVRLRIEEIVRELYLEDQLYSRNAFLGISMGWPTITHAMDPRVPLGAEGIFVENVVAGTAADDAGLQRGDIIISLDGQPVRGNRAGADPGSFSEVLRRRGVGASVTLTVLRFEHTIEVGVTLRARPREYYDRDSPGLAEQRRKVEAAFVRWWKERFTAPQTPPPSTPAKP